MSLRLPRGFSQVMRIGEGGFATVYRARQAALDRCVAVKVLHERDARKRRDLLREGTTQARIDIPCVPRVYDAFEWRGRVCIVMQWVKGAGLSTLAETGLPRPHRLRIADGFVRALAELHALGYAHRDLKPANLLVSPEKGIYFLDFGFTKSVSDGMVSAAGLVKGTPAYMAPELWRSANVDYMRADLYAAGRILRELLGDEGPVGDLIATLLNEDPAKRPGGGAELLRLWESVGDAAARGITWRDVAGAAASQQLSRSLYAGACDLLRVRRNDEAYWLLVESLQEDPDYTDAVALMSRFGMFGKREALRRKLTFALAAALAVCLGLAGFLVGRAGSGNETVPAAAWKPASPAKVVGPLARRASATALGKIPLLADTSRQSRLSGVLHVDSFPAEGGMTVDGAAVTRVPTLDRGMEIAFGEHSLAWTDDRGVVRWRQHVRVLPFEDKVIRIPRWD